MSSTLDDPSKMTMPTDKHSSWMNESPAFTFNEYLEERESMSPEARLRMDKNKFGVTDENDFVETPELVSTLLGDMREALEEIDNKEAYETALFWDPANVESVEFLLAFLRADDYDPNAAAQRMVNYWDQKVELFGTDIAFKESLSILDVKLEDCNSISKGGLRLLPYGDDFGRSIIDSQYKQYYDSNTHTDSMRRLLWLLVHIAIFDEERGDFNQVRGMVFLAGYQTSSDKVLVPIPMAELIKYSSNCCYDLGSVLPVKVNAVHQFSTNWMNYFRHEHLLGYLPFLRKYFTFYPPFQVEENLKLLQLCGIRPEAVPVEQGGRLDYNYHEWLEELIFNEITKKGVSPEDIEQKQPGLKYLLTLLDA